MTVLRARIVKAAEVEGSNAATVTRHAGDGRRAVRIPRDLVEARAEAEALLTRAREEAARLVGDARASAAATAEAAAREATEQAEARAAARHLALRAHEARAEERSLDRTVELAVLLAERLLGEALEKDPARLGSLARTALTEARGARRVRIEVRPDDVARLHAVLATLGLEGVETVPNDALGAGSLLLDTDVGTVDARLRPQLERLAGALRTALAEMAPR